jgi:hypothetical protein
VTVYQEILVFIFKEISIDRKQLPHLIYHVEKLAAASRTSTILKISNNISNIYELTIAII